MSFTFPVSQPRPPDRWIGVLWIIAAVAAWMVTPVLVLMLAGTSGWGRDCSTPPGASFGDVPPGCPREGLGAFASMMVLGVWILGTCIVAFAIGIAEGRFRRFAYRRRICAVLVTLVMPWAILAYAAGNGLGRAFPAPSENPVGAPTFG